MIQFCSFWRVEALQASSDNQLHKAGGTTENANVQAVFDFTHLQGGTGAGIQTDKALVRWNYY